MGKDVALDPATLAWARARFARYYAVAVVAPPPELPAREFAAFPFASEVQMRRHTAFADPEALRRFLPSEVPRHVYYSSAYYASPAHPAMAGKEWLGADLIFDLDADHLRGASALSYVDQLARVREKAIALHDEFLVQDLGIDPSAIQLVFSGGRGYHLHVWDSAYRTLTTAERREIVDYVLGLGVVPGRVLRAPRLRGEGGAFALDEEVVGEESRRASRRSRPPPALALPPPGTGGWPGRIARALEATLARWIAIGTEATIDELVAAGLKRAEAARLARLLLEQGKAKAILDAHTLDVFKGEPPEPLLKLVLERAAVEVQGETDAPVTTDVHRLIRLPGSLHGGTGFRVAPVERDRLDRFDPFADAVPFVGGGATEVELTATVDYPFAAAVHAPAGERRTLPDAVALFLTLRGEARPAGP